MFDKDFWKRQYHFKLDKDVEELLKRIIMYIPVMVIWYLGLPVVVEIAGNIFDMYFIAWFELIQLYFLNPFFWMVTGYMFAVDNDGGSNLFLIASALIFVILMLVRHGIENGLIVLENVKYMILLYAACGKIGMKLH